MICLKDCFAYIKFYVNGQEGGNITYKIVDFDLNVINNITKKYENFFLVEHSQLLENGKVNEFFVCIKHNYITDLDCQMIKILYFQKSFIFIIRLNIMVIIIF